MLSRPHIECLRLEFHTVNIYTRPEEFKNCVFPGFLFNARNNIQTKLDTDQPLNAEH
jgi:hypothetical protein